MNPRPYILVTAVVFSLVGLLHLLRILLGWSAEIGGWAVPLWLSWLALGVLLVLVFHAVRLLKALPK